MAKTPSDADLIGGRPNLSVPGGVTAARMGAIPKLGADAAGLEAIGKGLAAMGGDVATATLRERDRYDDMRVEDAFNQLRAKQMDLSIGPQNGFANVKGGDAVNGSLLKDWGTKFDDASNGLEEKLSDDVQKERFRARSAVARRDFEGDMLRHVSQQQRAYAESTFKGTIDIETRKAMSGWDDPHGINLSLERVNEAVRLYSEDNGWKPDDPQRQALGMHAVSGLHAAVITQALQAGDPDYAEKYFQANKASVDPNVVKSLGHQVADGVQKALSTTYQSSFLASRDDIKGLGELITKVEADPKLDEDRKNILVGRFESRRDRLVAQSLHEEDRRQRLVRSQIDGVNKLTLAGYEPTAEQMLPLVQAAKGTDLEGEVKQMIAVANASKAFRYSTPQQQEATITALETEARKDPTKFDVTVIDRFKKMHANQQAEIQADPTTFAVRQGFVKADDPAAAPLDLKKLDQMGEQLQARFNLSRSMQTRYGAPTKPLTKEEADGLSALLKAAPVEEKSATFAKLATASGGDFEGYKAVMAQIAPDDPVTAHAGIMAGKGRMSTDAGFKPEPGQATNVSSLILQGQAVLRPNRREDGTPDKGRVWPMPKDTDFEKLFSSYEGKAFAGNAPARNGFYQTAKAIYAARTVEAGDTSGILDSDRWGEAMKLSTGGVESWHGKEVVMPWGMSRGQFKDELRRRAEDMQASGALPKGIDAAKLYDMPLESIGDGRYMFRAGDGILVGPSAPNYGPRADGSPKGNGFLGVLKRPDGRISSELSIGVNINGKEMEVPSLVPTLTKGEVQQVLSLKDGERMPEQVVEKAVAHAQARMKAGKPVFATLEESPGTATAPIIVDFNKSAAFRTSGYGVRPSDPDAYTKALRATFLGGGQK